MAMRYRIEKKEACLEHQITNEVRLRLEATNFFLISEAFFLYGIGVTMERIKGQ